MPHGRPHPAHLLRRAGPGRRATARAPATQFRLRGRRGRRRELPALPPRPRAGARPAVQRRQARYMGAALVARRPSCWPTAATPATAATWTSTSSTRRTPASERRHGRGPGRLVAARLVARRPAVRPLEYLSINESYVHLVDVATGEAQTLTPRRPRAGRPWPTATSASPGRQVRLLDDRPRLASSAASPATTSRRGEPPRRSRPTSPGTSRASTCPTTADDRPGRQRGRGLALHVLDAASGRELPAPAPLRAGHGPGVPPRAARVRLRPGSARSPARRLLLRPGLRQARALDAERDGRARPRRRSPSRR